MVIDDARSLHPAVNLTGRSVTVRVAVKDDLHRTTDERLHIRRHRRVIRHVYADLVEEHAFCRVLREVRGDEIGLSGSRVIHPLDVAVVGMLDRKHTIP